MRILYLEPFWGGSHRSVALALAKHLPGHFIQFCHLPDRFWRWRMRAASFDFLKQLEALAAKENTKLSSYLQSFDLIFASTLFDIAQFKGLLPVCPPILAYFHENQLCYPEPQKAKKNRASAERSEGHQTLHVSNRKIDAHFGLTNISSALAADAVAFNSEFQRQQFLDAIPAFLQAFPDNPPTWATERIREKSKVLHLGIEEDLLAVGQQRLIATKRSVPPVILWNHRWEYDKQPEVFFAALRALKRSYFKQRLREKPETQEPNTPAFRLVVLGQNAQAKPQIFEEPKAEFAAEILHWGFSENDYAYWLSQSDIVISCAIQENFGLAVMEAVAAGAWPLLPKRLSYPELFDGLAEDTLAKIFYCNFEELVSQLKQNLCAAAGAQLSHGSHGSHGPHGQHVSQETRAALLEHLAHFTWSKRSAEFQNYFSKLLSKYRKN